MAVVSATGASGSVSRATVLWDGGFAPNSMPWNLQARPGSFAVVPAPGGRSGYAGRFEVRPGDSPIPSGERAEVWRPTMEFGGSESIWAWSVYFPAGFASNPNASWNVFTQWHHEGRTGPQPVSFEVQNRGGKEAIRLRVWGGDPVNPGSRHAWILAPLERNSWYDFVVRVRWADDATGAITVWLNGRRVVNAKGLATLYRDEGVYLKQGFYREASPLSTTVYIARTRQLSSLDGLRIGGGRPLLEP